MHSLRNLVVGTDFSPAADAALDFAVALAKRGDAAITLVHVCEQIPGGCDDPATEAAILDVCGVKLLAACARFANAGVAITPVLRSGVVADKIHNVATEVGASLIVIGRASRGSLGRTTEHVLRTATRSVAIHMPLEMHP